MKVSRFLGLVAIFFFCPLLLAASSPDSRDITDPKAIVSEPNAAAYPIPVEDLFYTRSISGPAWSPDGQQVVFSTDMSGRFNLWKVNASGVWPLQLVQSDERQFGATWSPDGKWIVYQQDTAGNELWDLYAVPAGGGKVVNLTATPEIREERPLWSRDGKTLALNYKPKEGTVYDIALMDWETKKVRKLTHETSSNHSWGVVAWSADGTTLFENRGEVSGVSESDVYAVEIATGKLQNLTPHQGKILFSASSLSPDGMTLLITSNQKNGYQNVALLDVTTKKLTCVTDTKWDADSGDFCPDGKSLTYLINADGRTDPYLFDRATLQAEKISLPAGLNFFTGSPTAFAPEGARLLVSHESSTKPADLWVWNVANRRAVQLTFSAIASLETTPLPPSQIVHYKAFDGKRSAPLCGFPSISSAMAAIPRWCFPTVVRRVRWLSTSMLKPLLWCHAVTSALLPMSAAQLAMASIFKRPTSRIWAGGICRTRFTPPSFSRQPVTSIPGKSASRAVPMAGALP